MSAIKFIDVRKGMVLAMDDGMLYMCLDRDLNTPGNWRAILQLKLRNLKTNSITLNRVRPDDKTELAYLETRDMTYSYKEGDDYIFMDSENFEQMTMSAEFVAEQMKFLRENDPVKVTTYEGRALTVQLPKTVELKVVEAEPAIKGATASAQYKAAVLETGMSINVPGFINVGEMIRIDTETGEYQSRGEKK